MTYPAPAKYPDARVCVVHCKAETVVYANSLGLKAIGEWISWLAEVDPNDHDKGHFHVVFHLESEESRFHHMVPRNVWSLRHPDVAHHQDQSSGRPDISFCVASEEELNVLSKGQESGLIPNEWLQKYG